MEILGVNVWIIGSVAAALLLGYSMGLSNGEKKAISRINNQKRQEELTRMWIDSMRGGEDGLS